MNISKQIAIELLYYYWKITRPKFIFQNKPYFYFCHRYNITWRNERAVEIPILKEFIKNQQNILEVGNVLNHYLPFQHNVIDKYESAPNVVNQDIINFFPARKYNLIISISTFEHIGWDEPEKDPDKILRTIEHLKENCLAPNGKIIFSAPLGYNPNLDKFLADNRLNLAEKYFFKRISNWNTWRETDYESVKNVKYASPYAFANAIIIGVIK